MMSIPLMGLANFVRGGNVASPGLWLSLPIVFLAAWCSWDWRVSLAWVAGFWLWQSMPWGHWTGLERWTGADLRPAEWELGRYTWHYGELMPENDHAALMIRMAVGFELCAAVVWVLIGGGTIFALVLGAAVLSVAARELGWQLHERVHPQPLAGGIPYGEALEGLLAWGPLIWIASLIS